MEKQKYTESFQFSLKIQTNNQTLQDLKMTDFVANLPECFLKLYCNHLALCKIWHNRDNNATPHLL